ncbi:LCP family protein [Peterkaempfera griseoplana]|uniref:LCP family protein n=1 Tax=Peterkaempfera griseoplana TaxID=66896 RepID=UPI0006E19E91|nr:LCP family protein [Peterkaempfera griseoplana]
MSDDPAPSTGSSTPPRPRRWELWLAGVAAGAVLIAAAVGWSVLHGIGHAIGRIDAFRGIGNRPAATGSAENFLLVGTDDREGIPPRELKKVFHAGGVSCHCTDTMMLVHLSRDRDRATVISIPRDSYVTIPAHTDLATGKPVTAGRGKINAAYGLGGAPLTVQTVEQATGIRVDHYLQVDFRSFVSTVDALGGVSVCTTVPLHDPYSGLDLPAGTTRLDGAGALKYVRARHLDASSDLGRMQRQQHLVAQILRQATSGGILFNPARLNHVLTTALKSVKADQGLTVEDLLKLAASLRNLSAGDTAVATVPVVDINHTVPGWGSTVLWDAPAARALFDAVRQDRPLPAVTHPAHRSQDTAGPLLTVAPQQIRVQVLNGTATPGLGARVDADLRRDGFVTTGLAGNAGGSPATRTQVRYDPRWNQSVRTLAAALPGARLVAVPGLGPTLQVVPGSDYTRSAPVPSAHPVVPSPPDTICH